VKRIIQIVEKKVYCQISSRKNAPKQPRFEWAEVVESSSQCLVIFPPPLSVGHALSLPSSSPWLAILIRVVAPGASYFFLWDASRTLFPESSSARWPPPTPAVLNQSLEAVTSLPAQSVSIAHPLSTTTNRRSSDPHNAWSRQTGHTPWLKRQAAVWRRVYFQTLPEAESSRIPFLPFAQMEYRRPGLFE